MLTFIHEKLDKFQIDTFYISLTLFALLTFYVMRHYPELIVATAAALWLTAPVWVSAALLFAFWNAWTTYVYSKFQAAQDYVLLEIHLPREVAKSPLAMELFLMGLHNSGGETTFIDRKWLGKSRPFWSLEIVSLEGNIHFFIRARKFFQNTLESRLYAQYPDAEIVEVPDYALQIAFDEETMGLWGMEYKLSKPDPFPIKTYVDYGLDKDPKEEYKIDPLLYILEYFSTLGKGENFWHQIIVRARKGDQRRWLLSVTKHDRLKEEAKEEIKKIMAGAAERAQKIISESDFTEGKMSLLTGGEKDAIDSIERSLTKPAFEVGMRSIYFAKKENFNAESIVAMINLMKPFGGGGLTNGFSGTRFLIEFDYPWQDFMGIRKRLKRRELFHLYRRRAYFHPPYRPMPFILTTEELATIFHFPGEVAKTPTLQRVPSRRAGAPSNLPI